MTAPEPEPLFMPACGGCGQPVDPGGSYVIVDGGPWVHMTQTCQRRYFDQAGAAQ